MPRLTRQTLHGVWAAMILPWTDDDKLDEARWAREVRAYGGTGVHGVYTGGTTGEFYAQDDATFERVTHIAVDQAHAVGLPIQIGCTALATRTARQRIRTAVRAGADAIQIALPFWLELKDDEVLAFLDGVVAEADLVPIVLYLTSRSKRKLAPPFLGEVAARYPTILGTKDTGCDVPTLQAMLIHAPDLAIFGGEDFYKKVPAGGKGGYCSVSGLNPQFVVRYFELCEATKLAEAKPYADTIDRYMSDLVIPMINELGLLDSGFDRIQRVAGGVDVGLRCQSPYRSATPADLERLVAWCRKNAPELLPGS